MLLEYVEWVVVVVARRVWEGEVVVVVVWKGHWAVWRAGCVLVVVAVAVVAVEKGRGFWILAGWVSGLGVKLWETAPSRTVLLG